MKKCGCCSEPPCPEPTVDYSFIPNGFLGLADPPTGDYYKDATIVFRFKCPYNAAGEFDDISPTTWTKTATRTDFGAWVVEYSPSNDPAIIALLGDCASVCSCCRELGDEYTCSMDWVDSDTHAQFDGLDEPGFGFDYEITLSNPAEPPLRWRVQPHAPSGTCYLKVWLQKRLVDDVSPLGPYEWIGTGNPCLAEPLLAYNATGNLITPEWAYDAATEYHSVEIVKWSCLPGYEPDITDPENPQPNGFPDPTWEPAAP